MPAPPKGPPWSRSPPDAVRSSAARSPACWPPARSSRRSRSARPPRTPPSPCRSGCSARRTRRTTASSASRSRSSPSCRRASEPPAEAVAWLLDQQCADGGFQAYRSDISAPCTESDPANYVGEDSNSTALASAALTVLGELDAADAALGWLESAQNDDGGFPYFLGGTSDVNSTAIALLATNAVGLAPTQVTTGSASAADYLTGLQVGCSGAATDEDGGFAYADFSSGTANDSATVQAALAITGAALPFVADPPSLDVPRADCPTPPPAPATTASASASG